MDKISLDGEIRIKADEAISKLISFDQHPNATLQYCAVRFWVGVHSIELIISFRRKARLPNSAINADLRKQVVCFSNKCSVLQKCHYIETSHLFMLYGSSLRIAIDVVISAKSPIRKNFEGSKKSTTLLPWKRYKTSVVELNTPTRQA